MKTFKHHKMAKHVKNFKQNQKKNFFQLAFTLTVGITDVVKMYEE